MFKLIFKYQVILSVAVLSFLISFSGCVTSKVTYVEEDKLPKDKVYRISEVYLKDGSVINLKDAEPKFKPEYKEMTNVIVYFDKDYKTKYIELKNIDRLKIEILESNLAVTILIIIGSIVILAILLFITLISFGNIAG